MPEKTITFEVRELPTLAQITVLMEEFNQNTAVSPEKMDAMSNVVVNAEFNTPENRLLLKIMETSDKSDLPEVVKKHGKFLANNLNELKKVRHGQIVASMKKKMAILNSVVVKLTVMRAKMIEHGVEE